MSITTERQLHVAPHGDDWYDGTAARPLATLTAARDALRGQGSAGATVWLHTGIYRLTETFLLTEADSGTVDAPVVYAAWPGDEVRLSGGVAVPGEVFTPVTDPAVQARLDPAVREQVRQCDLTAFEITNTGGQTAHGFAFPMQPADADVYLHDRPLPNARWPRQGYAAIGPVPDDGTRLSDPASGTMGPVGDAPPRGATFTGDAARLRRWHSPADLKCFGMWVYEWAPSTKPVQAIDTAQGTITLSVPSAYGVKEGKPYCIYNALEEIAAPGEWAIDRAAHILYLFPPEPLAGKQIVISDLREPLVTLRGARHIELRGLILEAGRGTGIDIQGEDNRVAGCVLRNLGGRGVLIDGARNGVQSCHLYQLGQGGITLAGGDRRNLISAENYADNNVIYDVNRVCTTYNPSVHLYGVGQRVTHNDLSDGPHNAILLHGNDHWIAYNEIHHMGVETDDAAAFYMGRNPSEQGNVIAFNYFHHIGSPSAWGTSAIYTDDGASGLTVRGNVFYRCGHAGQVCMGAVFNNAGKDHLIEDNVFVDCGICYGQMLMLQDQWEHYVDDTPDAYLYSRLYQDVDIRTEAYQRRYTWLAELKANATRNTIRRNLGVRCGVMVTPEDRQRMEHNWMTDADPGFADLARLNFALSPENEASRRIAGFTPPPFAEMGLFRDAFRTELPENTLIDCRPEMVQPQVSRPGETAPAALILHLVNTSAGAVTAQTTLWTTHPEVVHVDGPTTLQIPLAAHEVKCEMVPLRVTARPDVTPGIGAKIAGSEFSLPAPVRPCYQVMLARQTSGILADLANRLTHQPALPFLYGEATWGELRMQVLGEALALHAHVRDAQVLPASEPDNFWGSPYLGVLAAAPGAADTSEVHQYIFFPHGPGDSGTAWYFQGHRQLDPDAAVRWSAFSCEGGWELSALLPLTALGLPADADTFRLEAMVNLALTGTDRTLLTLFGSKPARLELATLAEVRVE